ncbi:uncharacterized protein MYCGRDRAFT_93371 [Zymoseptoria tritici IPO323]|uniref:Uncharacterized protein n=1 Tax=Zymoseptoria tritici (strain CBS 115943 / IPO323) TaxID=336722 RepID=F9XBF6_ZYMTI|nr:uncharacterized protein MYCGRDRAFT_93371 [Zymoseptoria tritici IPO323]EGP87248.1 hypothetical protein MYCGRDRAFT_93371 [Zymoseptoria tritici IPO323]
MSQLPLLAVHVVLCFFNVASFMFNVHFMPTVPHILWPFTFSNKYSTLVAEPKYGVALTENMWNLVPNDTPTDISASTIDGRLYTIASSKAWDFLGPPSSTTDQYWDDLSAEGHEIIMVRSQELEAAGYNASKYFQGPTSWGFGKDMYPVQVDVFHQIHCLDQLRKQMYADHYYPRDQEADWQHLGHCLHILLQNIQCHADTNLIPHRWVENSSRPYAQFSIDKQCRNFHALKRWNKKHSVLVSNDMWASAKPHADSYVWEGYGEDLS